MDLPFGYFTAVEHGPFINIYDDLPITNKQNPARYVKQAEGPFH